MKKILFYGLSSLYGGVETFIINCVNHLAEEDYTIDFVVMDQYPEYLRERLQRDVNVHIVPSRMKNLIKYHREIDKLIKNGRYDIVWGNFCTLTDISVLVSGKKYKVPVRIAHAHSSQNMGGKLVLATHLLNKTVIRRYATHFYACSNGAGEFMYGRKIMNSPFYHLMKNGIDTELYDYNKEVRTEIRKELEIENKIVIGHVGRFSVEKNHEFLLGIFNEFHRLHPESVLMLTGDGEQKCKIEKMAEDLNIRNAVLFLGVRSDVWRLMQGMDIFVLPSKFEGIPFAVIEAQAAGLPCILADTVTTQAKITDLVTFENLDVPMEKWVTDLENSLETMRRSQKENIKKSGYDMGYQLEKEMQKLIQ